MGNNKRILIFSNTILSKALITVFNALELKYDMDINFDFSAENPVLNNGMLCRKNPITNYFVEYGLIILNMNDDKEIELCKELRLNKALNPIMDISCSQINFIQNLLTFKWNGNLGELLKSVFNPNPISYNKLIENNIELLESEIQHDLKKINITWMVDNEVISNDVNFYLEKIESVKLKRNLDTYFGFFDNDINLVIDRLSKLNR